MSSPEPTVLDWLRSILKRQPIPLPPREQPAQHVAEPAAGAPGAGEALALKPETAAVIAPQAARRPLAAVAADADGAESAPPERPAIRVEVHIRAGHLRLPVALILGLAAQLGLERKPDNVLPTLVLYAMAMALAGWAAWEGDFGLRIPAAADHPLRILRFRPTWLGAALAFSILTLLAASDNTFRTSTLFFWFGALACVMIALWDGELDLQGRLRRILAGVTAPRLSLSLDGWAIAVAAVFALLVVPLRQSHASRARWSATTPRSSSMWLTC
jgi:hypothetical protein